MKIIYVGVRPSNTPGPTVTSYECDGVGQPLPPVCEWSQIFLAVGENGERVVSRDEAKKILNKREL